VGKNDCTLDVVVAVHGVDAVEERDGQPGGEGLRLHPIVHFRPARWGIVFRGRAAAAEYRAEVISGDVGLASETAAVSLGHLADFFGQAHAAEQILDAVSDRGAGIEVDLGSCWQGQADEAE